MLLHITDSQCLLYNFTDDLHRLVDPAGFLKSSNPDVADSLLALKNWGVKSPERQNRKEDHTLSKYTCTKMSA